MFTEARIKEFEERAKALHQELRGNMVLGRYDNEIGSITAELRRAAEAERGLWDEAVKKMAADVWDEAARCEHEHPERSNDLRLVALNLQRLRREVAG